MAETAPRSPLDSFVNAIRKAMGEVLSQALAAPWNVELGSGNGSAAALEAPEYFEITAANGIAGKATLLIAGADALALGKRLLAKPAESPSEFDQDHKKAVEQVLRRVIRLAGTRVKNLVGEVRLELSSTANCIREGQTMMLLASEPSVGTVSIQLRLGPELLASLSSLSSAAQAPSESSGQDVSSAEQGTQTVLGNNLDRLLGVNLNLTLRFGQRVLTLRELLNLSSGSVVELDRQVQEPADLILGGKVIARGEVIIVDGNYGIRITEMADPHQRIDRVCF
jgi:flagellar motor switch protein FliN